MANGRLWLKVALEAYLMVYNVPIMTSSGALVRVTTVCQHIMYKGHVGCPLIHEISFTCSFTRK